MNRLDNLRQQWQNLDNATPPRDHCPEISSIKGFKSNRSILLRHYRILVVLCLIWIIIGPLFTYFIGMPLLFSVVFSLFFAIMGVSCYCTYSLISGLKFGQMTVCELLQQVEKIIKSRLIHRYVGLLLAVPILSYMLYFYSNEDVLILGGVVGLFLGCVIGYMQDAHIRRALREIRLELMSV